MGLLDRFRSRQTQPPDPGMAVKMAPPGLADLDRLIAGEAIDEEAVVALCDFVDARHDCADFRMLALLRVAHSPNPTISPALRGRVRASVLGFRYWMDEVGDDSMCFWSENHQAIFATAEYLAGQLLPEAEFTNPMPSGHLLTGAERRARGHRRLMTWFADRFRYGFTEWLSTTYYEEDVAPLALLVDLAADADVVRRAEQTLDLLLLDMASHSFQGRLSASAGRAYAAQKQDPELADVNDILDHAFGSGTPDLARMSGLFVTSSYRTPEVLRRIATTEPPATGFQLRETFGLDVAELDDELGTTDRVRRGLFAWLMEAFTTPETIADTMHLFRRWKLSSNRFLSGLSAFARLPDRVLPTLVRALNPATQGVAIQRANVQTWRGPHGQLSSAQVYHPGGFGDQQHLWQASLPGGAVVFATHPGAPMFDDDARNFSPSAWVGNGVNPSLGQAGRVLLASYDLRTRSGYLERDRQRFTHLFWPTGRFDEHASGPHVVGGSWLVARSGDGYLGIVTTRPLTPGSSPDELVQTGDQTGYVAVLGAAPESFEDFAAGIRGIRVATDPLTATVAGQVHRLTASGLSVDGEPQPVQYPRFDMPWVRSQRNPTRLVVEWAGERLVLDATTGERTVGPVAAPVAPGDPSPLEVAVDLCDAIVADLSKQPVEPWLWGPALFGFSLAELDRHLGEHRYEAYLRRYADHHLAKRPRVDYSDHVAPALITYALQRDGHLQYAPLTDAALDYIRNAPRAVDDAVNHLGTSPWNWIYPRSVWVDSLMMFSVFPAMYGRAEGDAALLDVAARQPRLLARRLQDPKTRLWHHSYWVTAGRPYPRDFWARGNGWVVASLPMILDQVGQFHPERPAVASLLATTSEALLPLQRGDGTWRTVLGPRPGGYRELSATALIASGWLHAVREGYLSERFREPAERALEAVTGAVGRFDGKLALPEISGPTIPVPLAPRLGYVLTPTGRNLPWGVAAFVHAAINHDRLEPVRSRSFVRPS